MKVAICGAGPAGLAAAIEFAKLPFVDWRLYEQASKIREIGAGITTVERANYWSPMFNTVDQRHVSLGSRLIGVEHQDSGKVRIEFANGFTDEVDLLVGGDGVRSVVRKSMFPDHTVSYVGRTAYRAVVTSGEIATVPDVPDAVTFWHGPNSWLYTCPLGDNKFEITTITREPAALKEKVSWGLDADLEDNARHFEEFSPVVRAVCALPNALKQYALFAGPRLKSVIAHGSVALIGDASHPLSGGFGAGAGFALEDVYVLTRSIAWARRQSLTLQHGLSLFDRIRGPHYERLYHVLDQSAKANAHIEQANLGFDDAVNAIIDLNWSVKNNWIAQYDVLGEEGLDFMGQTSTPLRIFRQVSHKVPGSSPELELGGRSISTAEICRRVALPEVATLGESNPFSLDVASAQKQAAALQAGKRITGHTALLKNEPLWAYAAGGIGDDHNAHETDDVVERLRLGMMLTVMSGSMNSNIQDVFRDVDSLKDGLTHIAFCADDKLVEDLDATGHIDRHVREAIALGISPAKAYRMATLNPAMYYRLDHILGSISPGRLADLLILERVEDARPETVIVNGVVVARNNKALFKNTDLVPPFTLNTIHLNPTFFAPETYSVKAPQGEPYAWIQAMEMYDGYFKRAFHARLEVDASGSLQCNLELDVLKVVVIDRHHETAHSGIGFVRGFGLRRGAIACTTNCENQNLVVIGTSDSEIAYAARSITDLGGGYVTVAEGEVLAAVRLDVAGCMSSESWESVRDQSLVCDEAARSIGCTIGAPFMIASFVGLNGVPDLGLTEKGLIDCQAQELMDVVLHEELAHKGSDVRSSALSVYADSAPVKVCCRCPSHSSSIHRLVAAS
ncbi:hypothetical protein LTR36_005445 [Oleoguttula mirabilis]|uniref:FAD-binding domain-containing protein n=1 Tax=Oleoguttula mirabilis TaxID=1507867 RepID=A0AAV9JED8_9PEZI|nr:hypothetical protein LTR36_005445 [Oleoguttula mirabilis]